MMKPLNAIRVADLSRVLAGPYCGQLLADMGAQVIKVESPGGDENRGWPPAHRGISTNFGSVNRGKYSLTLDLKSPEAASVLRRLAEWADVMLHNFLPETAEKLGISYEKMSAINPRLIFCSISGFGEHGPLRNRPGYDTTLQAFSGVMAATGEKDGPPIRTGVSFLDMSTGISAYAGVLTALFQREHTGRGTHVHGSLLETSVACMGFHGVGWLQLGVLPGRNGSGSANIVPYQSFDCADGRLVLGAPNEMAWKKLCNAMELQHLAEDERFRTNKDRVAHRHILLPILQERLLTQTGDYWSEKLSSLGVAVAPIQTLDQVMRHPQVIANGMVVETEADDGTRVPCVGMPFKLKDAPGTASRAAPRQNQDCNEVLRDILGFDEAKIESLARAKAVFP
jgi:crotonobetainyl-CoA:carnitine CoA-transferase CaiB-like acyl-CoA transferase